MPIMLCSNPFMKKVSFLLIVVLFGSTLEAQTKIFKEVSEEMSTQIKAITQDNALVGYLAFTRLESFAGKSQFRTWMTRIAINQCLMALRKRRHYVPVPFDEELIDRYVFVVKDAVLEGAPARMDLEKMMSVLTDSTREMLIMACLDGNTEQEIAESLGLSLNAVRCKLSRTKRKLRDMFSAVAAS